MNPILNRIRYMWYNLYRFSEIVSTTFAFNYLRIYFASGDVIVTTKTNTKKTFIVTKIKISFSTIVKYKYFTMFHWRHSTCIDVDVWIDFNGRHAPPTTLQQHTDGRCCKTFSNTRDDTSRHHHKLAVGLLMLRRTSHDACSALTRNRVRSSWSHSRNPRRKERSGVAPQTSSTMWGRLGECSSTGTSDLV